MFLTFTTVKEHFSLSGVTAACPLLKYLLQGKWQGEDYKDLEEEGKWEQASLKNWLPYQAKIEW